MFVLLRADLRLKCYMTNNSGRYI